MSVEAIYALSAEGDVDTEGSRSYRVTYSVWTDSVQDGPITVRSALGLSYSSFYVFYAEQDAGAFFSGVSSVKAHGESQTGRKEWRAVVSYSTKPKKRCDENQIDDPLLQPEKRGGTFVQFQKPLVKDRLGQAFTNSALIPFFDAVMDDSRPTLVITKNFATLDLTKYSAYKDAVNVDTFYGMTARKWKVMRISWEENFLGSCAPYYPVTFEFQLNPDTWDEQRVDAGFEKLVGGVYEVILDTNGLPKTSPTNLDGFGDVLTPGAAIVYRRAQQYPVLPFGNLGIQTSV